MRRNRRAMREPVSLQKQERALTAQTADNPLNAARPALDRGDKAEAARNRDLAVPRYPTVVQSAPERSGETEGALQTLGAGA